MPPSEYNTNTAIQYKYRIILYSSCIVYYIYYMSFVLYTPLILYSIYEERRGARIEACLRYIFFCLQCSFLVEPASCAVDRWTQSAV